VLMEIVHRLGSTADIGTNPRVETPGT